MGKERIIRTVGRGLGLTKDFVTKPYLVPSALGTTMVSSVFGVEIVEENIPEMVVSGVYAILNASGTLFLALGSKHNSPKTPH